jgi:hypothetical protein
MFLQHDRSFLNDLDEDIPIIFYLLFYHISQVIHISLIIEQNQNRLIYPNLNRRSIEIVLMFIARQVF